MKLFQQREIKEAIEYSSNGGQALHIHRIIVDPDKTPSCFVNAVARGEYIAHLLDQDTDRLIQTAFTLGACNVRVMGQGKKQHIDLCGMPLAQAYRLCGEK